MTEAPFYLPVGDEVEVFTAAWRLGLPVMLKGPTGCGKTRLVEHVAHRVGVDLHTVSCHEDMTATDLLGRFTLAEGSTTWVDGPLTTAVRAGAMCYLDEIVEARQDAVVAIHSLCDHRRELYVERLGGLRLQAAPGFQLVVSYNPGYQSILKDLKVSTRQRMVSIELGFPEPEIEHRIVMAEAGASAELADRLVRLGQALRRITDAGLREVASTRMLIAAAALVGEGLTLSQAARSAIVGPLTDDSTLGAGLLSVISTYAEGEPG